MSTEMDVLVAENIVFDKTAQRPWSEADRQKHLGRFGSD
jgi:hypothetical protein